VKSQEDAVQNSLTSLSTGDNCLPVSVEADLQHSDINEQGGSLLLASRSMCTLNLPFYKLQCLCLIAFVLQDKLLSSFQGIVAHG